MPQTAAGKLLKETLYEKARQCDSIHHKIDIQPETEP